MRVSIISTGEEVLRGEIADENASFLSRALVDQGIDVGRRFCCGDGLADLMRTLEQALADTDAVIGSGGLGPTADDRTLDALAQALDAPLQTCPEMLARLRQIFSGVGLPFTDNQARQARRPAGAEFLPNELGTAPGIAAARDGKPIFWLPGPPFELQRMFANEVLPRLQRLHRERFGGGRRHQRTLRLFGRGEGWVGERLAAIEALVPGIELGFRAALPEIEVKLYAGGAGPENPLAVLDRAEAEVRARLGDVVFSSGPTLPQMVLGLLVDRKQTLAAAESCTGGLFSKLLTDAPGASAAFVLGAVTYANSAKEAVLGVPAEILEQHGAVSEPCARAMAEGARRLSGADLAVAITGIAGPDGGTPDKPVGLVHFALAHAGGTVASRRIFRNRGRDPVRALAAHHALDMVRRHLLGLPPLGPPPAAPAETR
mgnify:CR=1 FL=1